MELIRASSLANKNGADQARLGFNSQKLVDAICPQGIYDVIENSEAGSSLDILDPSPWLADSAEMELHVSDDLGKILKKSAKSF